MENKIAIIDIETTGLNPINDKIIEVGIVSLNLDSGETNIIYNKLVKEQGFCKLHRDSWIFQNSDLQFEQVENAHFLELIQIGNILANYPITAYNKDFDFSFLNKRGLNIPLELPCPMKVAADVLKLPNKKNLYPGYKWPSVQEAWEHLFPFKFYKEKHRAADDAEHEAQIVLQLYRMGVFKI